MKYFPRTLLDSLMKWIDRPEIFAITGPRQSGKITLLKMLKDFLIVQKGVDPENIKFLNFEDRDLMEKFASSPKEFIETLLGENRQKRWYIFIDEFQYLPEGGQKLKLLYDTYENIKFAITGSSSLELNWHTAKFLVGRVFLFNLYQLSFAEFINTKSRQLFNAYNKKREQLQNFLQEGKELKIEPDIFKQDFLHLFDEYAAFGGYPEVVKANDKETKKEILKNIYQSYINRDIIELLKITDNEKLRKMMILLASQIGNVVNYNSLATDTTTYFKQIKHYLSILEETYIISRVRPYFANQVTELKKNPKVYFVDWGLRNSLINNFNSLAIRTDAGSLVENVVFRQLTLQQAENAKYWRTTGGAEVDFILEIKNRIIPVEVKYVSFKEPKLSRGYRSFINQYRPERAIVLTKGLWGKLTVNGTKVRFIPVWYA